MTEARTPPEHLSPSGLSSYRQCARKWWESYMEDHPRSLGTVETVRGNFVHSVLEHLLWMPAEHRTPEVARGVAGKLWWSYLHLDAHPGLTALHLPPHELDRFAEWTWKSIEGALGVASQMEPVAIELKLDLELGGVPFFAFVDVVEDAGDDEVEVEDWKTGRKPDQGKPWSREQNDEKLLQPLLYGAALRELGQKVSGVTLLYIPAEDRHGSLRLEATDEALDDAVAALSDAWTEILHHCATGGTEIEPSTSTLCGWCDFVGICPEGRAEVEARHAQGKNIGPAADVLGLT